MRTVFTPILTAFFLLSTPLHASDLADDLGEYLDFAGYAEGIIMVEQLTRDILPGVTFVDARSADEFAANGIDGALHIEWRETLARLDEMPQSGMVVVYCDASVLSTQAMLVARLMGRKNVLVLQGGLPAWLAAQG